MSYTVVCSTRSRKRWLAARLEGIGASEIPSLLGLTRSPSPVALWARKRELDLGLDAEETERMEWGRLLEPAIARKYEQVTGRKLFRWQELCRWNQHPDLLATPDYYYVDLGELVPVELKNTDRQFGESWTDGAPPRVYYQGQQQVGVVGATKGSIGVLVGGNKFWWYDYARDEAAIALCVTTGEAFMALVRSGEMPPVDSSESTAKVLAHLHPRGNGESVMLPTLAINWSADLERLKADRKAADSAVKLLENELRAAIGPAEIGLMPDGSPAWTLRGKRGYHVDGYDVPETRILRRTK